MKKNLLLAVALLMAVGGAMMLKPASTSAAWSDCGNGLFCAWYAGNASGTRWDYPYSVYGPVWTCRNIGGSALLNWYSAYNRYGSGLSLTVYNRLNCSLANGGGAFTIQNGQAVNLFAYGWGDQDSSFMIQQ